MRPNDQIRFKSKPKSIKLWKQVAFYSWTKLNGNKQASKLSILVQVLPKSIQLWKQVAWKQACIRFINPSSSLT